jgi:hypothetical protein
LFSYFKSETLSSTGAVVFWLLLAFVSLRIEASLDFTSASTFVVYKTAGVIV